MGVGSDVKISVSLCHGSLSDWSGIVDKGDAGGIQRRLRDHIWVLATPIRLGRPSQIVHSRVYFFDELTFRARR